MREKKLFFEAIDIADPARRASFLRQACQGNSELRRRIDALLAAADSIGNFLEPALSSEAASAEKGGSAQKTNVRANPASPSVSLDFLEPPTSKQFIGKLGYYDIISLLGHGAFGIVLKAFDRRLHRQVAIKVLAPQLATTSPPRKRFIREAQSCAKVRHPNVVHLYDITGKPTPFIAMELIEGQTLQDRIDDAGPLEIAEVIEIAEQLASGLEAAHAVGLIHRDIKPSNILIENRIKLRIVLTDFGLARAVDDASLTQSGVLAGTPIFMSPEQAQGQTLDYRSDLFSLGSVFYVMITGRMPFRSRSTVGVLQRVVQNQARPISELAPDCPPWLEQLVNRLHEKSRDNRIQSATELRQIIESRGKSSTPRLAPQPVSSPVEQATPSSHRKLLIGGGIAAMSILALTIGLLAFNRQDPAEASSTQPPDPPEAVVAAATPEHSPQKKEPLAAHWQHLAADAPTPAITPFDREAALKHQTEWAEYLGVPVEFTDALGIKFRLIPPGEFVMGTSAQDIQSRRHHVEDEVFWKACLLSEAPQHHVALTKPFYLATTEVTQNQFESIMSQNPSYFQAGGEKQELLSNPAALTLNFPVEGITWQQTQQFLRRLARRLGIKPDQPTYRLPTEAEWEFACRGGTQTTYWTGDQIDSLFDQENHSNYAGGITDVGSFQSNPFGLYDMSGNVHEYVQDRWDSRYDIAPDGPTTIDPLGPTNENLTTRVARGGDFWWWAYHSRSAYRIYVDEKERSGYTIGFRLACDIEAYPAVVKPTIATAPVTDFSEIHAASLDQLKTWLDSLHGKFVPQRINVRWGSPETKFDAVAINDSGNPRWQVDFFDDDRGAGRNFNQMRRTHDIYWKVLFPSADTPPLQGPGLKIWWRTLQDSATWNVMQRELQPAVDQSKRDGWLPMSLAYTESGGGKNSAYVHHHFPSIGNQSFVGLTLAQFQQKVPQFRDRKWRLHVFQMQVGTSEPKVSCVFRENLDQLAWDVSFELTQSQYEQELIRRRFAGWYPTCVGSYMQDGIANYLVAWEKLTTADQAPPPPQRDPGAFGQ